MSVTDAAKQYEVEVAHYGDRSGRTAGYRSIRVRGGRRGTERVVPPAGEEHAFDIQRWARVVEISVSPTGRSVRVFVDGKEVKP